ncbi:MAG: hypothetical protein ACK5MJ_07935 [Alphaproteobacteria bacterium]
MKNINLFVKRWHEICQIPLTTHWDGQYIKGALPKALKARNIDESYYGKDNTPICF